MRILLTGANGYIGKRLLPYLINQGHEIFCAVRDPKRFKIPEHYKSQVTIVKVDLLKVESFVNIPKNIDAAYYLVHSMSGTRDYENLERLSAVNFVFAMAKTSVQHVIYLSGIANEKELSKHLNSRLRVEKELEKGNYNFTCFRAGIIIGSGSASFEIIRDIVEKLPLIIGPKWLNTKCQPIGVRDVIDILGKALFNAQTYNQTFDIGGKDILSYKNMLKGYAETRELERLILAAPFISSKISAYFLYFITATSYKLATALVHSMRVEVVCKDNRINQILNIDPADYPTALQRTLVAIETENIPSSWKDSFISGKLDLNLIEYIKVPSFGVFKDARKSNIRSRDLTIQKIWRIGGKQGWYSANWLWELRGFLDKLVGGVGLRRGRRHPKDIQFGDAIDFWRVLFVNKEAGHLLLFAEMKLPGEAWLEFKVKNGVLYQVATFRPKGVLGRLYWYAVLPFHGYIFKGMIRKLTD